MDVAQLYVVRNGIRVATTVLPTGQDFQTVLLLPPITLVGDFHGP